MLRTRLCTSPRSADTAARALEKPRERGAPLRPALTARSKSSAADMMVHVMTHVGLISHKNGMIAIIRRMGVTGLTPLD